MMGNQRLPHYNEKLTIYSVYVPAPVILDFNFAAVLGSTKRDKFMKKDELDIVELYLAKGLAGQPVEDDIPKEVQRLLR